MVGYYLTRSGDFNLEDTETRRIKDVRRYKPSSAVHLPGEFHRLPLQLM